MIISCDPGLKGCLVELSEEIEILNIINLPFLPWYGNWILDVDAVQRYLKIAQPRVIVIEKVGVCPNDGKTQAANFMRNFGSLIGACAGFPRVMIPPVNWKGGSGLLKKPKAAALPKALEFFPEHWFKGHSNKIDRCDACLLGRYYLRVKEKIK